MQYNILIGGGFSKGKCLQQRKSHSDGFIADTSNQIAQIIEKADPDILVLNEFCYIGYNPDTIGQEVASRINMPNYFVGEDYFTGVPFVPSAIFTKEGFEIIDANSLKFSDSKTEYDIFRGVKALVQTPNGNMLNIFGLHLTPFCTPDEFAKKCQDKYDQVGFILESIDDISNTIITGDMNFPPHWASADLLRENDWKILNLGLSTVHKWVLSGGMEDTEVNRKYVIDQAWIHRDSNLRFVKLSEEELSVLKESSSIFHEASDHNPNVFKVGVSEIVCKRLERIIGASDLQSG